jgi:hypothetical protein
MPYFSEDESDQRDAAPNQTPEPAQSLQAAKFNNGGGGRVTYHFVLFILH